MYDKFIDFLKKYNLYDEEIMNYIKPRTIYVDYKDEESIYFIGCFPKVNDNNILERINLCVPYIEDDISLSMNIHEYVHLFVIYKYLNKEYVQEEYEELLPVMYELIYLKDNNVNNYIEKYRDHIIKKDNYLKSLLKLIDDNDSIENNKRRK